MSKNEQVDNPHNTVTNNQPEESAYPSNAPTRRGKSLSDIIVQLPLTDALTKINEIYNANTVKNGKYIAALALQTVIKNIRAEEATANINLFEDARILAATFITDANSLDDDKKTVADALCEIVRKTLEGANVNIFTNFFQFASWLLYEARINYNTAAYLIKGLDNILVEIDKNDRLTLSPLQIKYLRSQELIENISAFLYSNAWYGKYENSDDDKDTQDIIYEKKTKIYDAFCSIIESLASITKNMPALHEQHGTILLCKVLEAVKMRFNDILYSTGINYDQEHLQEFLYNILAKFPIQVSLIKIANILLCEREAEVMHFVQVGTLPTEQHVLILSRPEDRSETKLAAINTLTRLMHTKETGAIEKELPMITDILGKVSFLLDFTHLKHFNKHTEASIISSISTILEAIGNKEISFGGTFDAFISLLKHPLLNSIHSNNFIHEKALKILNNLVKTKPEPVKFLVFIELLKELATIPETKIKDTTKNLIKETINSMLKLEAPLSDQDSLQKSLETLKTSLMTMLTNSPTLDDTSDSQGSSTSASSACSSAVEGKQQDFSTTSRSSNVVYKRPTKQKLLELLDLALQSPIDNASVSNIFRHKLFKIISNSDEFYNKGLVDGVPQVILEYLTPLEFHLLIGVQTLLLGPSMQYVSTSDSASSTMLVLGEGSSSSVPTIGL